MKKISSPDWKQRFLNLEKQCFDLEKRCTQLLEENRELKEKLNTNSKNSSKPPSQDPNRRKRPAKPSGKNPGGQPGHTGHSKKIFSPDQVTKTIEVKPHLCANCGGSHLSHTPISLEIRQVIELPEIHQEVTQYNIHTCRCGRCGKHVRAKVPKEAERGFGPRLMGFVTMLTGEGHLSKRKICSIVKHLGIKSSLGALCNIHRLASELLQAPADAIQKKVLQQARLNADESSWRIQQKRCWIWIGATPNATFFKIDPSRSQKAYLRIFSPFQGTLTTDRYGAYNQHPGLKQICLAHIDRHFEKMGQRPGKVTISRPVLQARTKKLMDDIKLILLFATQKAKNSKSIALAYDLLNRFPTLWTYLVKEGVEPTNNLAERGLRPAVIFRKLSGGNQSEWGARFVERLMTMTCTLKQNAKNLFTFLTAIFRSHVGGRSPPLSVI